MFEYPDVRILDKSLCETFKTEYISLDYNEDFYGIGGECRLVLPATARTICIQKGMYIHLPSPYRSRTAIITGVAHSEGETDTVIVSAYPAKTITKRRVNLRPSDDNIALLNYGYDAVPLTKKEGIVPSNVSAETALKTYVGRHMADPEDSKRRIDNLKIVSDKRRGKEMAWLAKHGDVLADTLEQISRYSEVGYHIYAAGKNLMFDVLEGRNKSRGKTKAPVVFTVAAGTASSAVYEQDDNDYKNLAYAEGDELENGLTAMLAVSDGDIPSGIERREIMINASAGAATETATELSYTQIAKQKLSQYSAIERVSSGVVTGGDYIFLRDWDIGDIVTVESQTFKYSAEIRITGVKESYSSDGASIMPTFGDAPDIRSLIKTSISKIRSL